MALNDNDRLDKITKQIEKIKAEKDKKIKQLKAQERAILARQKENERKERTRRLIQLGAILDSMGVHTLSLGNDFKTHFEKSDFFKHWLNSAKAKNSDE